MFEMNNFLEIKVQTIRPTLKSGTATFSTYYLHRQ